MIKLTFVLTRRPELTREAFQVYWFDHHAPLVASVKDVLRIRRYVQLHSLPAEVSETLRQSRGGPEGYDGVAQLCGTAWTTWPPTGLAPKRSTLAACCWKTKRPSSICPVRRCGGARRR